MERSDRVQEALAAYLEHLELGGPEPDTSHLSRSEREELEELIGALDSTEGMAFGLGRDEPSPPAVRATAPGGRGELLLSQLRETLPPDVRIEIDTARPVSGVGGIDIAEGWVVGTFGGRLRVWLLAAETAQELEGNRDCLADLNRVFGALPDTTAVALTAEDLTCLMVQPEDCAPQINIPSGSLVGRRYRHPIRPVAEAVADFLKELIPPWDPIPAFDPNASTTIDASGVGEEFVRAAIEHQRGIGQRARKGNPKKDALLALGDKEMAALLRLTEGLFDGSVVPDEIEQRIERLAEDR